MLAICGIDGSAGAAAAAEIAIGLARRLGGSVLLVHVAETIPIPVGTPGEIRTELEESHARRAVDDVEELLDGLQLAGCERLVTEGDPAQRLIEVADERGAELIVVGSQGRSGLRSMILGSVSAGVVRGAGCPVLVIPQRVVESG